MSETDFQQALQDVAAQHVPPPRRQAGELIEQLFRRDARKMRLLAVASLLCWFAATAGVILLVVGLNRFVIDVRIHHLLPGGASTVVDANHAAVDDAILFDATDLLHHSMPFLAGSAAAMMLAALFTVLLVFTSRQATMNRISASLVQIAEEMRQLRSGGTPSTGPAWSDALLRQKPVTRRVGPALCIVIVAVLLGGLAFSGLHRSVQAKRLLAWQTAPRLAPFDALRWHGRAPEAHVNGQWCELIAVDGVPVEQILAADQSPGFTWQQKHFGEDLVELMSRVGHPTGATVALTVRPLPGGEVRVLRDVPMTAANRAAVLNADLSSGTRP